MSLQGKGKQQSLEENIYFRVFISLQPHLEALTGAQWALSARMQKGDARTHVRVVECVHKCVEIFLVEDEGVCAYLRHPGVCVRMH